MDPPMSEALCKCGAPAHSTDSARCENGHVLLGNAVARKHGVRAYQDRGDAALPPDLRQTVDAFRDQVIADRGGLDNLSAIEGGYIRRLSELETVARLLASDLATRGLLTAKGRVRNTLVRWLDVAGTWDKYATRIGIERRAKPVQSLTDWLSGRHDQEHVAPEEE
jgi:hypothetical protein